MLAIGIDSHITCATDSLPIRRASLRSCAQSRVQNPARSQGHMYSFLIGLFLTRIVSGSVLA